MLSQAGVLRDKKNYFTVFSMEKGLLTKGNEIEFKTEGFICLQPCSDYENINTATDKSDTSYCSASSTVTAKHQFINKMWCWRRMEKISWTDHMRNKDVLLRVKEHRNILHEIRKRKANWIGHILRRNCLLQRVTEGKIQGGIEVIGRQGRRRRKLLDDLKERRGYSH